MKFFQLPALLAVAAMLSPAAAVAGSPTDAVQYFYSPVRFAADPELRDRFVDPVRGIFEQNDALVGEGGEIGCIDFDPAIGGQDFDEAELERTLELREQVSDGRATVIARFRPFADSSSGTSEIEWSLTKVGGEWKISDIASLTDDWRLSEFACE